MANTKILSDISDLDCHFFNLTMEPVIIPDSFFIDEEERSLPGVTRIVEALRRNWSEVSTFEWP